MSDYTAVYDLDEANDYFTFHPYEHLWDDFDIDVQENCLYNAERTIWRYLGGGTLTAISQYDGTETYREDFAVFEQALATAQRTIDANASRSGIKVLGSDESIEDQLEGGGYLCKEAQNWLSRNHGQLTIARG